MSAAAIDALGLVAGSLTTIAFLLSSRRRGIRAAGGYPSVAKAPPEYPWIDDVAVVRPRVEPRAGLAFRVHPWITLRALVAFDAFNHLAATGSGLIEFHTRSYDAFYGRRAH